MPSVGTGRPGRIGRPSKSARNGSEARTCREMPRHSVVDWSRITFSIKIFLEIRRVSCNGHVHGGGWHCCGGRDRWVGSLGAIEGRRHGRGGGGVGDAGGGGVLARRRMPTCGRRRRGPVREGWEARCAFPLRELLHMRLTGSCDSAAGGNVQPRQHIVASHHSVPQRTADVGVGAPGCHLSAADTRVVSVLTCEEIFPEA